jgi:glycosyltransferase involved in cell wall biosynthesis
MRIAIDATSIPPRPAGAGIYAIELARALTRAGAHDGYALFTRGHWLDDDVAGKKNWRIEHVRAASRPARLAWEQLQLPHALSRLHIDVLHSTHHTLPLRGVSARRVVTIHDVTFFRIPQRYPAARRIYMQTLTRMSARAADAIIVPSRTVRDDTAAVLGVDVDKIAVVYEAAGAQYVPIDLARARDVARRYGIDGAYVLSVGSLEPGKNRARLIRAMRLLRDDGVDAALVIVGQPAWKYEDDLALIDDLDMRDRIIMPGYVAAADLPALYSGATAVALPSLYEGFGLPVLEAMACAAPVLTSNVSATAEVAGDAALLVDPHSLDAIRDGLRTLVADGDLRADLAKRGLARAAEFSWDRAATETRAVYERAANGAPAS